MKRNEDIHPYAKDKTNALIFDTGGQIQHLTELLEQLLRDVQGDLRQANMTLNDTRDDDFLSTRHSLIHEIKSTLRVNSATLDTLIEMYGEEV